MDHAFLCAEYPLLGTSTQLGSTSLKQGVQMPSFSAHPGLPVAVLAIQTTSCSSWQWRSVERKSI